MRALVSEVGQRRKNCGTQAPREARLGCLCTQVDRDGSAQWRAGPSKPLDHAPKRQEDGACLPTLTATEVPTGGQDRCNHGTTHPKRQEEGDCAPKSTATEVPNGGQDRCNHGTTHPKRQEEGAHTPKSTATEAPNGGQDSCNHGTMHHERQEEGVHTHRSTTTEMSMNDKTITEGHGTKHWRRVVPERDNPREVAAARMKLAEEIMGNKVSKKLELRGLVFPRWPAARHLSTSMLREYATRGCPVQTGEDWTAEQLQVAVEKEQTPQC